MSTSRLPAFFMNSIPKSGTHLLKNILQGLPGITHSPVHELYEGYPYELPEHFYQLGQLQPGTFGAGHIYYSKEWAYLLQRLGMKQLFISRDPRDVVVSYAYFIANQYPAHPLHSYFQTAARTQKERYLALLFGVQEADVQYPAMCDWFARYLGWRQHAGTLALTFEELVRDEASARQTLLKIIDYLWEDRPLPLPLPDMMERMKERMHQKYSFTFRSGKIGGWRTEFDEDVTAVFKQTMGPVLLELGYEQTEHW